jgi:cell division protein ZapA
MKQVEVTILGQTYLLACPPGGQDALMAAVTQVDREMVSIRDAGKIKARERIAVLAALNLAYGLAQKAPAEPGHPAPSAPTTAIEDSQTSARIDLLISRIDQSLGADGQLL